MNIAEKLSEQFNCCIEVWDFQQEWKCEFVTPDQPQPSQVVDVPAYLEKLVTPGQPFVQSLDCEQTIFFTPVETSNSGQMVAIGITRLPTNTIHQIAVKNSVIAAGLQERSQTDDENLDLYASQISADFEELAWLRCLADHLAFCTVDNSFVHAARETMPGLMEIIRTSSLVLLKERKKFTSSESRFEIHTFGAPVNETFCRDIVESFEDEARCHPVVKNAMGPTVAETSLPIHSFILTSIAKDDEQFGWLLAVNKRMTTDDCSLMNEPIGGSLIEFGTPEASLMQAGANLLATHGKNYELFRAKENLLIGTLRTMINAVDAKDPYTCGHSDRVAQYARRIAREMNLPQHECEQIYVTGLVHDIGKVGVPDHILKKPGSLTAEEFAEIKKHPQIGFDILKHLEPLNYVLPGVLHHHEAYDGSGYPLGLAGDEIPLKARILAVADAYDAMTSDRPYRDGMPTDKAESILRNGAGGQWDEDCVSAFFDCVDDIYQIASQSDQHVAQILRPRRWNIDVNENTRPEDSIENAVSTLSR